MGTIEMVKPPVDLYEDMRVDKARVAVIRTAVEDFAVPPEDADAIYDAFLQWMASLPARPAGQRYVMLKSDVDRIFHAFILNTQSYREFCHRYLGRFVDHHPITGDGARIDVENTVAVLESSFGANLSPFLRMWSRDLDAEAWTVSCFQ
ncbi:hypothetical protein [Aeromicrobium duanguangcaii]|uniref:hypothetical protein n=1 Tax=Aeromicrobium duanguangcaii TaxID=2968086 RepID=UPI0020176024|nr:hypothetical protein [Aeromicrobium duanguangcaii]MCL3838018.1 hypothetical protein [Aeromicrobium duanguangcaii]